MGLVVLGSGTLDLTGTDNTYSGGTLVVGATLQAASASCLGNSSAPISLDGGTLQATGAFNLSAPIIVDQNGGTIDTNGYDSASDGPITGNGTLTKIGSGTLDLSNTDASGFSGSLIVAGWVRRGR